MCRFSCLEVEVFGACAAVSRAECVQITNGLNDLFAFMSVTELNMLTKTFCFGLVQLEGVIIASNRNKK